MKEIKAKPILFSTLMVQALLAGRKTQTRIIVKDEMLQNSNTEKDDIDFLKLTAKQKYWIGDILWVKETWSQGFIENGKHTGIRYKADDVDFNVKWKPSLFMKREDSRIYLKVTSVRIERLNDISEEDAIAEGVNREMFSELVKGFYYNYGTDDFSYSKAKRSFQSLWNKINGSGAWDLNPFVWVIEFEIIK